MCDYCSRIRVKECFYTPREYEKTIEYVKELIEIHNFILVDGNCKIGCHENKSEKWIDDIIYHTIKCPKCEQTFSCIVNTYRGGGSFKKGS